ncbi:MAG: hypothetical protein GF404_02145 [candidate division Zixibacteria bacterium]|jgi:ATP synthase protein I|nr:hypothetical protein [candidate division Zixibacteria bacterium]
MEDKFGKKIGEKEQRKLKAKRDKNRSGLWFGLGMFGLVGWSVAIPTLICLAIGIWLDSKNPGSISWTLTFLVVGVILGSLNAWYWVKRESSRE